LPRPLPDVIIALLFGIASCPYSIIPCPTAAWVQGVAWLSKE